MPAPSPTIWLVSDRADWVERVRALVRGRAMFGSFVLRDWAALTRPPPGLPRLICWDVARWSGHESDVMSGYAERFYNYASVVWVSVPHDACPAVLSELVRLGYGRIVAGAREPLDPATVLVGEVLESALWLVPGVMGALGVSSSAVATAYALVLADPAAVGTVETWNRLLGYDNRRAIGTLQEEAGVGAAAWAMLAYLRLLAVVDWASRRPGMPTGAEIARRFGYSSGKVLARHAERATGRSFGELLAMGPERMLALAPGAAAGGQQAER